MNNQIKKYEKLVGKVLKSIIKLSRDDKPVQIKFENISKQEYYMLKNQNVVSEKSDIAVISKHFPLVAYNLVEVNYDTVRALAKSKILSNDNKYQKDKVPVEFIYDINIGTTYREDYDQLIQQLTILFNPSILVNVIMDDDIKEKITVPFVLQNMTSEDLISNGDLTESKVITINMSLKVKGYLYQDTNVQNVIDWAEIDFYADEEFDRSILIGEK
jgi:hypothetical protein